MPLDINKKNTFAISQVLCHDCTTYECELNEQYCSSSESDQTRCPDAPDSSRANWEFYLNLVI